MKDMDLHSEYVDSALSANIVGRLQKEGKTLKQIGNMMGGLSHSYISLVKSRRRNLTMAHLKMLEEALNRPLPLLFLQAIEEEYIPKNLRTQYRLLKKILKQGAQERELSWKL